MVASSLYGLRQDCPNHEWGFFPQGSCGINETDSVLGDLKCMTMGRRDGVVWDWDDQLHQGQTQHIHKYMGIFCFVF